METVVSWIPAYRAIFKPDHWLAPTKWYPASKRDAWLDLCQMATWQPRETKSSGIIQRGELVVSIRTLAARWKWSKDSVNRFKTSLHLRTALETVRETPDGTVYRIVNYETYAVGSDGKCDSNRDTTCDSTATAPRQEQEGKKERKKKTALRAREEVPLPEGWSPTPEHRQRAASLKVDVEREAELFRAHAETHDRRAASWNAAFTTWLLKAEYLTGNGSGNGNGQPRRNPPPTYPDLRAASAWLPQGGTP